MYIWNMAKEQVIFGREENNDRKSACVPTKAIRALSWWSCWHVQAAGRLTVKWRLASGVLNRQIKANNGAPIAQVN